MPWRGQLFQVRANDASQLPAFDIADITREPTSTGRRVSLLLKPRGDVSTVTLYVRAGDVEKVSAQGHRMVLGRRGVVPAADEMVALTLNGLYGREIALSLNLVGNNEVELIIAGQTAGVIGDGLDLVAARPATTAQVHQGDHQLQVRRVKF